jgi:hypothetical protein
MYPSPFSLALTLLSSLWYSNLYTLDTLFALLTIYNMNMFVICRYFVTAYNTHINHRITQQLVSFVYFSTNYNNVTQ